MPAPGAAETLYGLACESGLIEKIRCPQNMIKIGAVNEI